MNRRTLFKFRLYVAGDAPNSVQARVNLAAICRTYLPGLHEIEIVDVFQHPKRALIDGIFITPTLVRVAPAPVCRIIGALSQVPIVLQAMGLETVAA